MHKISPLNDVDHFLHSCVYFSHPIEISGSCKAYCYAKSQGYLQVLKVESSPHSFKYSHQYFLRKGLGLFIEVLMILIGVLSGLGLQYGLPTAAGYFLHYYISSSVSQFATLTMGTCKISKSPMKCLWRCE